MHFLRLLTQRGKILMQLYLVPCIYVVCKYICMHDVNVCCICIYMWQDPCAPVFGTMYICLCMYVYTWRDPYATVSGTMYRLCNTALWQTHTALLEHTTGTTRSVWKCIWYHVYMLCMYVYVYIHIHVYI